MVVVVCSYLNIQSKQIEVNKWEFWDEKDPIVLKRSTNFWTQSSNFSLNKIVEIKNLETKQRKED